jgi:peptide/nickel transport system substrate-binding protein
MSRRNPLRLLSATLLLLVGAVFSDSQTAAQVRRGGTAVVALSFDPATMNPLVTTTADAQSIQRELLFAALIKYDTRLRPVPWLAERWDTVRVGRDSLDLTFHLRRDVRWHDGKPVTAEDVRWTFERAVNPRTGFIGASWFGLYRSRGEVLSPYTIRFRLRRHADFLDGWRLMPPVPSHILGDVPPEQLATHPFGTRTLVGNGPFRFARRTPGQEWVFKANPQFPSALGGRPLLDRVVFRSIPDATTRLTELLTGGIDVANPVQPVDAARLEPAQHVRAISSPTLNWTFIAWNTRLPFFDTPEERQALTMALDRRQITSAITSGTGIAGRSLVTPSHWAFSGSDPRAALPFDQAAARRLLAAAGWQDRNGDGVLEDGSGRPFRFTLKTLQGNATMQDAATIAQAQLRQIGVAVQIQTLEAATLISQFEGAESVSGQRQRNFEAVTLSWSDAFRKDDSQILHSRNRNGPRFWTGYSHPRLDHLIDTLGVIANRDAARPLWSEYQRHLAQAAPFTVLYYPKRTIGVRTRLRGVEMDPRGEYISAARWWLAPERR